MFIVAKLKHSDNLCIAFCEGRCEVFCSWLVPEVEADQFSGLGTGAIPQAPHLVIVQDVLLWLVQILHILLLAVEALFLCPDSAGNAQCDSGFMPREYYKLLVHQYRSVSLDF